MIRVSVKVDINQARSDLSELGNKVDKAAGRALDRVATTVRKDGSDEIRQRLKLGSAVVKSQLIIQRPFGGGRLIRDIVASGKPIALKDYNARTTRAGVTYQVSTSKGRRLYTNKYGHAFIINKFGGNVFARISVDPPGKAKAKIAKVFGPSVPQYFVTRFVRQRMQATAADRWPIEFKRALNFYTGAPSA